MEKWTDIEGYEGYYQISSYGRIRNVLTENILKPSIGKNGYFHITLCYKEKKDFLIHRLVAYSFVPNPNNYKYVNHKDEIKTNNYQNNLEWCTATYNVNYGNGAKARNSKITQYDLFDNKIKEWNSMKDAAESLSIAYQNISGCCRGKKRTANGYKWKYT